MVGERIRTARMCCGFTQEELADKVGVIRQTITEYECGRISPSLKVVKKLSDAMSVPMEFFFED